MLGFGNIGSRFFAEVAKNHPGLKVKTALVRDAKKPRGGDVPGLTTDFSQIVSDPEIDIVVDVTAGEASIGYIGEALAAGKNVVTANKLAVATAGPSFLKTASERGTNFYFEACVGGGIPVINLFGENVRMHRIRKVSGILNGTTNFILTRMSDDAMDFSEALELAQKKGFAEPDPTFDISGKDSLYKIAILKDMLFDAPAPLDRAFCQGIDRLSKADLDYARAIGCGIRLVGYVESGGGNVEFGVRPVFLPLSHPLAAVKNEFNAIFIEGDPIGEVMLFGRGAGAGPTTASLVADVLRITRGDRRFNPAYAWPKVRKEVVSGDDAVMKSYLRMKVLDVPGVISRITGVFEKHGVSISSMKQEISREGNPVDVIFTTHSARSGTVLAMLGEISGFDFVIGDPVCLKMEL